MGPDRRGSKNSFCPRSAAARESRYLLVVSTGRSGSGDNVLMTAHSCGEKPSVDGLVTGPTLVLPAGASPHTPDRTPTARAASKRLEDHSNFRMAHLHCLTLTADAPTCAQSPPAGRCRLYSFLGPRAAECARRAGPRSADGHADARPGGRGQCRP